MLAYGIHIAYRIVDAYQIAHHTGDPAAQVQLVEELIAIYKRRKEP